MNPRYTGRRRTKPSEAAPSTALTAENERLRTALAALRSALETAEERERVRIADDLHDILGHALEVVAFKAELADRVLHADATRARSEMVEIQRVARSAMVDVRGLARCRRPTDLSDELADAVSLFNSAAVDVVVLGDARALPESARDPLARVVREAVTNVLRHSRPTRCAITVQQSAGVASVVVVNDGVSTTSKRVSTGGTGLAGLSRLLAEHGGRLDTAHDGSGGFRLLATVAAPATVHPAPARPRAPHPGRVIVRRTAVSR